MTGSKHLILALLFLLALAPTALADDIGTCFPEVLRWAPIGSLCHTADTMWVVEGTMALTAGTYFRDLKSGLAVTELTSNGETYGSTRSIKQSSAAQLCATADESGQWKLPSGYPTDYDGQYGFPNRDSDFAVLARDGVVNVVEHISHHGNIDWPESPWYAETDIWSSSRLPGYPFQFYVLTFPYNKPKLGGQFGETPEWVNEYVCVAQSAPRSPTAGEAKPFPTLLGGCGVFYQALAAANIGYAGSEARAAEIKVLRLIMESYLGGGEVLKGLFDDIYQSDSGPQSEADLARLLVTLDKSKKLCAGDVEMDFHAIKRLFRRGD